MFCAVLGFSISADSCNASGNHPPCRKCREEKAATPGAEGKKVQKKCERCPETFLANSNRHRFCTKCQKAAYRDKARAWDRENRAQSITRELKHSGVGSKKEAEKHDDSLRDSRI